MDISVIAERGCKILLLAQLAAVGSCNISYAEGHLVLTKLGLTSLETFRGPRKVHSTKMYPLSTCHSVGYTHCLNKFRTKTTYSINGSHKDGEQTET